MSTAYVRVVGPLVMPKGHARWRLASSMEPEGNPEATPECDAVHDCDWIVYRCNYPADFDGGVAL